MKKIKTYYTFLYYTLYKSIDVVKPAFLTDFKAGLVLMILEIMLFSSFFIYHQVIFKSSDIFINYFKTLVIVFVVILSIQKVVIFSYDGRWRKFISEFDTWPKEKTRKWKIIAWIFMIAIVANLVFSFYLMSRVDWSQYR